MQLDLPALPFLRHRPADAHGTLPLARNATLVLRLPRGARIDVGAGRVWLTERGDLDDHFIDAGGRHVVRHAGPVVLQGESALPARIRVTHR